MVFRGAKKIMLKQPLRSLAFLILICASCTFSMTSTSRVLVIAVDRLAVSDVNCSRELKPMQKSGFDLLCKNSVRFTHAFTPSLMSMPALTSILTGLYPIDHHVRNNGPDFLSANFNSVTKVAFAHNYRTALFSGGAPILRSSGLQQGFELFDENIDPTPKKIFRPADEIIRDFLAWSKETDADQFAVLYLPDLLFVEKQTVDEFGEARNLSLESQIENLDVNLAFLFSQMQKSRSWDSTTVILTGLSGHTDDTDSAKPSGSEWSNLHSTETQVALFIKPARKPRDEGLAWSFDSSVSLVDLGKTLAQIFDPSSQVKETSVLKTISLVKALEKPLDKPLKKPGEQTSGERWIFSESAWGVWKKVSPLTYSLRKNDLLMIHDTRDHFFNTLTDKEETTEISPNEPSIATENAQIQQLKAQLGLISGDKDLALRPPLPIEQALQLVEANQWQELKELGRKNSQPDWIATAERNLTEKKGQKKRGTKQAFADPCLQLIDSKENTAENRKLCNNRKILALFDEIISFANSENHKKETVKKKFVHIWRNELLFDRIMKSNFQLGEIWNLSESHQLEHLNFVLAVNHPNSWRVRSLLTRENF
jgi:arylsulfatase A-like enzyme